MNKKTTYELIIADKLQQLPLPDMEDAIWLRIKAQLDLDAPEGDGGDRTPQSPTGGWMWGAALATFVAAVIAVFVLTQKKENQQSFPVINGQKTESKTTPFQPPAFPPSTAPQPRSQATVSPGNKKDNPSLVRRYDSVQVAPLAITPMPHTIQPSIAPEPPILIRDGAIKPKANGKGVPNITDADYRIVPAKGDSM